MAWARRGVPVVGDRERLVTRVRAARPQLPSHIAHRMQQHAVGVARRALAAARHLDRVQRHRLLIRQRARPHRQQAAAWPRALPRVTAARGGGTG
eukprot:3914059-Prymnesium_polylepis.1